MEQELERETFLEEELELQLSALSDYFLDLVYPFCLPLNVKIIAIKIPTPTIANKIHLGFMVVVN